MQRSRRMSREAALLLTRIHRIFRVLLCHETSGARGETRDVTVILQETIEDLKSVIVTETNYASKETVNKVVHAPATCSVAWV